MQPTLDTLPGEGDTKQVVRMRAECDECGDPAHFRHTYLLPNARTNPASAGYRRDDISWCSDHETFTCKTCKRPAIDGYETCSTFPASAQFAHLFLKWKDVK
jgi:hypothetical protein